MATITELFARATRHLQAGAFPQAEQLYRQILQADPHHVDALHLLGLLAGQAGRNDLAIEYLNQALRLRPDFAAAHYNLGVALEAQGKLEEGAASYRQALRLRPNDATARHNLEVALQRQRKREEAISYSRSLQARPDFAEGGSGLPPPANYPAAESPAPKSVGFKPSLRVAFTDFWPNFQSDNNFLYHVLSLKYHVILDQDQPSVVFYSVFGDRHGSFPRAKKIHFTGEPFKSWDYDHALSFDPDGENNYRLPLWVLYIDWFGLTHPNNCNPSFLVPLEALLHRQYEEKPKFCNFVFSHNSGERVNFLRRLNAFKTVDSAGPLENSVGYVLGGNEKTKVDFLKGYRFTIAFENTHCDGYVTEKILHPLAAGSIPIYWGGRSVLSDFNPDSFLYAGDFADFDELVEKVRQIEESADLRQKYMAAPAFIDNSLDRFRPQSVAETLARIIG